MSPRFKQCAEDAFVAHLRLQTDIDSLLEELRVLRKQHSALRLARKLGISDQWVRDLCSGKRRPGIRMIRRIAEMEGERENCNPHI